MLIFLPIGIDQNSLARKPWVSWSIMILCCLVFMFGTMRADREVSRDINHTLRFYFERPYLTLPKRLLPLLKREHMEGSVGVFDVVFKEPQKQEVPDNEVYQDQQDQLERMVDDLLNRQKTTFVERWGLVPTNLKPATLLTHIFVHTGLIHLIGNLVFLFFTAPFLEDRWGRPFFAIFFVLSGVVSGVFQSIIVHSGTPIAGISGALAAVLGAFLIKFATRKINFLLMGFAMFRFFRFNFSVPAWVVIGIVALLDLLLLKLTGGSDLVAHWAHLSGFGTGISVALFLKWSDLGKYLNPDVFDEDYPDRTPSESADFFVLHGKTAQALSLLQKHAFEPGAEPEWKNQYWELALKHKAVAHLRYAGKQIFQEAWDSSDYAGAYSCWKVLQENRVSFNPGRQKLNQLFLHLAKTSLEGQAGDVAHVMMDSYQDWSAADLDSIVEYAPVWDLELQKKLLEALLKIQPAPETTLRVVRQRIHKLDHDRENKPPEALELSTFQPDSEALSDGNGYPSSGSIPPPPNQSEQSHNKISRVVVSQAVPLQLDSKLLIVQTERFGKKKVPLGAIKALAWGGVPNGKGHYHVLVDAMVDDPRESLSAHRVLRFSSDKYDPRKITGSEGQSSKTAFFHWISLIIQASTAVPLTDQNKQIPIFESPAQYEAQTYGCKERLSET